MKTSAGEASSAEQSHGTGSPRPGTTPRLVARQGSRRLRTPSCGAFGVPCSPRIGSGRACSHGRLDERGGGLRVRGRGSAPQPHEASLPRLAVVGVAAMAGASRRRLSLGGTLSCSPGASRIAAQDPREGEPGRAPGATRVTCTWSSSTQLGLAALPPRSPVQSGGGRGRLQSGARGPHDCQGEGPRGGGVRVPQGVWVSRGMRASHGIRALGGAVPACGVQPARWS